MEKVKKKQESIVKTGKDTRNNVVKIDQNKPGKLAKVGGAENNVYWHQDTLLIDLKGFVEGHLGKGDSREARVEKSKIIAELLQAKRRIYFLNHELEATRNELENFSVKNQKFINQLSSTQSDFKMKIKDVLNKKRATEDEYSKLKINFREKSSELENLRNQLTDFKERYADMESSYSAKFNSFRDNVKRRVEDKERSIKNKADRALAEKESLQSHLNEITSHLTKKREEVNILKNQIKDMKAERTNILSANESLLKTSNQKSEDISVFEQKIESLNVLLKDSQAQYDERVDEVNRKRKELETAEATYIELKRNFDKQLVKVSELSSTVQERDIKISVCENEIANLKEKTSDYDRVEANYNEARDRERILLNQLKDLKGQLKTVRFQNLEYSETVKKFEEEISSLTDKEYATKEAMVKKTLDLETKLKELEYEKDSVLKREEELEKETRLMRVQLAELKKTLADEKSHNLKLMEREDRHKIRIDELEKLVKAEGGEKEEYSKELVQAKERAAQLRNELAEKAMSEQRLTQEVQEMETLKMQLEHEKELFESQINELSQEIMIEKNQKLKSLEEIRQLNEKINIGLASAAELQDEKSCLEGEMRELESNLEAERTKIDELNNNIITLKSKNSDLKLKQIKYIEEKQEWLGNKEAFEQRLKDQYEEISSKEKELIEKQGYIDKYMHQQQLLSQENDSLRVRNDDLERVKETFDTEKHELNKVIDSIREQKDSLEFKIQESAIQYSELKDSMARMEQKELDLQTRLSSLIAERDSRYDSYEEEIATHKDEIEALKDQVLSGSNIGDEYKKIITDLKKQNADQAQALLDAKNQVNVGDTNFKSFKGDFEKLKKETEGLNAELENKILEIKQEKTAHQRALTEINNYKKDLSEAKKEQELLKSKIVGLEKKIESDQDFNNKVKAERIEQHKYVEEIQGRQEQLSLYSRWVDSQKASLQKHIVTFAKEMKSSVAMSPLKSYLEITVAELDKVQVAMNKPGVMGMKKSYLKGHFNQLTKQKEQIEAMMKKAQADVETKANEIMGLLKHGEFMPAPPLPPMVKPGKEDK